MNDVKGLIYGLFCEYGGTEGPFYYSLLAKSNKEMLKSIDDILNDTMLDMYDKEAGEYENGISEFKKALRGKSVENSYIENLSIDYSDISFCCSVYARDEEIAPSVIKYLEEQYDLDDFDEKEQKIIEASRNNPNDKDALNKMLNVVDNHLYDNF